MADLTVANTILEQLGGRRFVAMTGARNLVGGDYTLSFRLPRGRGFRVTLTPMDVYDVELLELRGTDEPKVLEKRETVYCDQLQEAFCEMTGLLTRL